MDGTKWLARLRPAFARRGQHRPVDPTHGPDTVVSLGALALVAGGIEANSGAPSDYLPMDGGSFSAGEGF